MKKFNYLFFCFVLFFYFKCNVFCEVVDGYNVDCRGNVVPTIVNKKGNFPNNSNNDCTFSFDSGSNSISSNVRKQQLVSCDKETESNKKIVNRNIILIIDNSGSMTNDQKPEKVQKIFMAIAKELKEGDKIKISYFKSNGGIKQEFSYEDLNSLKKRQKEAKKVLKKGTDFGKHDVSLVTTTNTDFVSAIKQTRTWIKKNSNLDTSVPIVFFITDGYPTKEGKKKLGYASSTQYFYGAAVEFENLYKLLREYGGNAKFVSVGLGIDTDSSLAVKYLLDPSESTKSKLNSLTKKSYAHIEDYKFGKLISGKKIDNSLKKEFVFSVASNPDIAMTGYSSINGNKITFKKEALNEILGKKLKKSEIKTINDNGFVVGPVYIKNKGEIKSIKSGNKSLDFEIVEIDSPKYFIRISGKKLSNIKKNDLVVELSSIRKVHNYADISSPKEVDLVGMVKKYYSIAKESSADSVSVDDIVKWVKVDDSSNNNKGPETIDVTEYTHNGISEEKTLNLGPGYVKKYNVTKKQYEMKSVSLYVNYLIDTSVSFDGGTLKNTPSTYAGGGFKFQDITLQAKSKWYYSGYAAEGVPVVSYKIEGNSYNINYNNVFEDSDGTKQKFKNAEELWGKIDKEVNNFISNNSKKFMLNFDTVDSNDPDKLDKEVKVDSSFKYNKTGTDSDTYYTVSYNYKVKQACGKDENFQYVDKECSDGYKLVNSFANEDGAYITGDDRYYFIPFGYKKEDAKVNVTLGVSGKQYTTTCTVKVNSSGNPCPDSGDSEPKSVEEQVSYRSIDVSNPFPRANRQYYRIPINWRNWYCTGVGTSNGCVENKNNINRLKGSYANIYYSGDYDSDKLTSIAKDTLNSSNNYYSSWENIDVETGKSKALDDNFIKQQFSNSAPSYCPLGSFDKKCDIYK